MGALGDLERRDGTLQRLGHACDACDQRGRVDGRCPRGVYHPVELAWRPARWWQRLMHLGGR